MAVTTLPDVDEALTAAVDEAFEDAECDACEQLAVCLVTYAPCGHEWQLCIAHRRQVTSVYAFRQRTGTWSRCADCHLIVTGLTWEPIT